MEINDLREFELYQFNISQPVFMDVEYLRIFQGRFSFISPIKSN
jgi:hypothetical protein